MPTGPKPKPDAKRPEQRVHPVLTADPGGWKGRRPAAPKDLSEAASEAWKAWFAGWWAAFWTPEDVPELRETIRLWDRVHRNEMDPAKIERRLDKWGLTPKGRQDLHWQPSEGPERGVVEDDELAKFRANRAKGA